MPTNLDDTMFTALLLACSLLSAHATAASSIIWRNENRTALIKLDTPGYPFWEWWDSYRGISRIENIYKGLDVPSAILLNVSLSSDNKTLYMNGEAILPLEDNDMPPKMITFQVPADMTDNTLRRIIHSQRLGFDLSRGRSARYRKLQMDYDRLVWADPAAGTWRNHAPTLRFRIMGLGADGRDDVLDGQKQEVLHITLSDTNHGISDDAKRSYEFTKIELKSMEDSYGSVHPIPDAADEPQCTIKSWRCPDTGLHQDGPPYYRFIWRKKFDEFGRIGSLRHEMLRRLKGLKDFWDGPGFILAMLFGIVVGMLSTMALMVFGFYKVGQVWNSREEIVRSLAEDDRLLGETVEEKYVDDEQVGIVETPDLIDLSSDDEDEEAAR